jgi:hypothetical protein
VEALPFIPRPCGLCKLAFHHAPHSRMAVQGAMRSCHRDLHCLLHLAKTRLEQRVLPEASDRAWRSGLFPWVCRAHMPSRGRKVVSPKGCIWGGRQPEPFHARQAQPTERCGLKFRAQNISPNSSTNLRNSTWQAAILSGSSALESEMHTPPRVPGCLIGSALNTDLRDYPQPRFQSAALPQPPAGQPNPSRAKPW